MAIYFDSRIVNSRAFISRSRMLKDNRPDFSFKIIIIVTFFLAR